MSRRENVSSIAVLDIFGFEVEYQWCRPLNSHGFTVHVSLIFDVTLIGLTSVSHAIGLHTYSLRH